MKNPSGAICGAKHRNKWAVWEVDKKDHIKATTSQPSTAHHQQRVRRLVPSQPSGHLAEEEGRPHPEGNPESGGEHQEVDERSAGVENRREVKKWHCEYFLCFEMHLKFVSLALAP